MARKVGPIDPPDVGGGGGGGTGGGSSGGGGTKPPGGTTLLGTAGADWFVGGAGDDVLYGFGGDDTLDGGVAGNDTLIGGDGRDTADYRGASAAIVLALGEGQAAGSVIGQGVDTLVSIENVWAGASADRLTGNGANNALSGNGGSDTILGGLGNDTLSGGDGDDLLEGGFGNDLIDGGAGLYDMVDYSLTPNASFASGVIVRLDLGYAQGNVSGFLALDFWGRDTLVSIERARGTGRDDVLVGGSNALGQLYGGGGNDLLRATTDPYWLDGGDGDDTIESGQGYDLMFGGAGADRFEFGSPASLNPFEREGEDRIWDFQPGIDRLVLHSPIGLDGPLFIVFDSNGDGWIDASDAYSRIDTDYSTPSHMALHLASPFGSGGVSLLGVTRIAASDVEQIAS